MTPTEIFEELKSIAQNVAFSVNTEPDPDFVWDGDGPDPVDEGMVAVNVTVVATGIVNGGIVEGFAYMAGHYVGDEEDSDLGGYLPQMLKEAASNLDANLEEIGIQEDSRIREQLFNVGLFLECEMTKRYKEQMAKRDTTKSL